MSAFKGITLTFVLERFDAGPPLYGVHAMPDFDPKRDGEKFAEQIKKVLKNSFEALAIAESPPEAQAKD